MLTAASSRMNPMVGRALAMFAALALGLVLAESPMGATAAEVTDSNQSTTQTGETLSE